MKQTNYCHFSWNTRAVETEWLIFPRNFPMIKNAGVLPSRKCFIHWITHIYIYVHICVQQSAIRWYIPCNCHCCTISPFVKLQKINITYDCIIKLTCLRMTLFYCSDFQSMVTVEKKKLMTNANLGLHIYWTKNSGVKTKQFVFYDAFLVCFVHTMV